jgi:hypothetical protein
MTYDLSKYIGQDWQKEKDCWYWFRKIQAELFSRDVTQALVDHSSWVALIKSAADIMTGDIEERFGWKRVVMPKSGDAIFMSLRTVPHHVGTVIMERERLHVIHALENAGVIYDNRISLRVQGWKIYGFWTPINES